MFSPRLALSALCSDRYEGAMQSRVASFPFLNWDTQGHEGGLLIWAFFSPSTGLTRVMYLRFKDEHSSNLKEGQVYSLMSRTHLSHVESATKAAKTSMPIPVGRSVQGRCLGVLETHSRLGDNYEGWIEMIKTSCIDV